MKALITVGCYTDHGGTITEGNSTYLVDGKAVHLDGMTHYCPKCKVPSKAIASNKGFMTVDGKSIVAEGDKATCGARYIKISSLAVMSSGSGSGSSANSTSTSNLSSFINNPSNIFDEQVIAEFEFAEGMPYFIETESGATYKGIIGSDGKLPRINTEASETYALYLGEEALLKGDEDDS